jgi:hypothetical protein
VNLELVGVECYGLGSLLYSQIDCYATLVCPWSVRLEIEEGDVVVGRLDTARKKLLAVPGTKMQYVCQRKQRNILSRQNIAVGRHLDKTARCVTGAVSGVVPSAGYGWCAKCRSSGISITKASCLGGKWCAWRVTSRGSNHSHLPSQDSVAPPPFT